MQRSYCEEIVDIVNKSGTKKYEQCSICIYFLICAIKISACSCELSVNVAYFLAALFANMVLPLETSRG